MSESMGQDSQVLWTNHRRVPSEGYVNIKFEISFDGKAFSGYQWQPHALTVQGAFQEAWKIYSTETVSLTGCSRLDAGVHAQSFVCNLHSKLMSNEPSRKIVASLNGILHQQLNLPIFVRAAIVEAPTFHSRYDALGKHYRYLLWYGRGQHAQLTPRCWSIKSRIEPKNLNLICADIVGTHDFNAFRSADCASQNSTKTIWVFRGWQHPFVEECYIFDILGDGFLKHMIRNLMGTLVEVALEKLESDSIKKAFIHGNRIKVGQCAPPHALSLMKVFYEEIELQTQIQGGPYFPPI